MLGQLEKYEILDRDNRVWSIEGASPTITSTGNPLKILVKVNEEKKRNKD